MPTNASINTYISDYELYHIYRKMYESKSLDKAWLVKHSQAWKRMEEIRNRVVNQNYISTGVK